MWILHKEFLSRNPRRHFWCWGLGTLNKVLFRSLVVVNVVWPQPEELARFLRCELAQKVEAETPEHHVVCAPDTVAHRLIPARIPGGRDHSGAVDARQFGD